VTHPHPWTLGAVGDVFVHRPDPSTAFEHSRELLGAVDVLFGNCEGAYTDRPSPSPGGGWSVLSPAGHADALGPAGFDVMAVANNHALDGGFTGLEDTLGRLHAQGIRTVGAGADLARAREPVVVEHGPTRVGFVAFSCVHPPGYAARARTPGVSAVRVESHYHLPDDDPYAYIEPGAVPKVRTFPRAEDAAVVAEAVTRLAGEADVVVASFHWGTSREPAVLADYERILGRLAVDAGADVVLGHHHHLLRGVEFHAGKPIFYGLGHFVFDQVTEWSEEELAYLRSLGEYGIYPRDGYPLLPFHPDGRLTVLAALEFRGNRLARAGMVPCVISPANHAVPAAPDTADGRRVLAYVRQVSERAGLPTGYAEGTFTIGGFAGFEALPR
jgi:poly-gamma-glutamate synthesis protein (capsule biosynthesis protein)